ncbi:IS21 family transposase [Porticoccus sp. GXU_MW_L64]
MNNNIMREVVFRLLTTNFSNRCIANQTGCAPNTVRRYRQLLEKTELDVSSLQEMGDKELAGLLRVTRQVASDKRTPDWQYIYDLMQKGHQTLRRIYEEEYVLGDRETAYSYSQFTHYYRKFLSRINVTMRQEYRPGSVVFVDFAGDRMAWTDPDTGEEHKVEIFIAVLGCSRLIFAMAVASQKLQDWVLAHNKMVEYFGGVPEVVVPDNLKSAVTRPGREPVLNPTYQEWSHHNACTIIPARVRRPKDKAPAEAGVRLAYRWILASLHSRQFFSLDELNTAISEKLEALNNRPFRNLPGTRASRFDEWEKSALRPLPEKTMPCFTWVNPQKVGIDYHIMVEQHAYSVPYRYVGERVGARVFHNQVELIFDHKRVALHPRSRDRGGHTTNPDHRTVAHQKQAEQTKANFLRWAEGIGEACVAVVQAQFDNRPDYSLAGQNACSNLHKLASSYGNDRMESACKRAQLIGSLTVKSVRSILQHRLDQTLPEDLPTQVPLPLHHNVRGPDYYRQGGQQNAL